VAVGTTVQAQSTSAVNGNCAAEGSYGYEVTKAPGATNTVWVEDDTPDNEGVYRMQFQFNTKDMTVPHRGKYFIAVALQEGAGLRPAQMIMSYNVVNGFKVWCQMAHNNGNIWSTGKVSVPENTWQTLMLEFRQSQGGGIDDGMCRITNVSSGETYSLENFRNSAYSVGRARIGLTGRAMIPTSGTHCWDDFASFRTLAP
jgi:hypothetical protein